MRQFFLAALFVFGVAVHASHAAIGGSTVWTATVTTTTKDPSNSGELCEIPIVGDDGVVIANVRERIFEIVPQSVGSPIVRKVPLEGFPWARVGGRTIVYWSVDGANRRFQWIGEDGKLISIPTYNGEGAFAENGECFTASFLDQRIYLTKWSANGEILFRKGLGRYTEARGLVLGPDRRLFVSMSGGTFPAKLFALNTDGDQLWSTNLGDDRQAPEAWRPTASGGVWVFDSLGNATRLTEDGFPDAIFPGGIGFALSPTDDAIAYIPLSWGPLATGLLADGGSAVAFQPLQTFESPIRPSIVRLSSIGTTLWIKKVAPPYRPPVASRIGNGLAYFSAWIQKGENIFECQLSAIDLGAPSADSACPFYQVIWPDGSRRARPRSHAPPTVTMIAKPRHSGAVIEFGVEDDLRYTVESADKPDGPWRSVGTVTGAGYGARFTDPTSVGDPMRLYRVKRSQ